MGYIDEDIVYLKTQSFSYYEKNRWNYGKQRYEEADYVWTDPEEVIPGMSILNKLDILEAYCEQYGDEERLDIIDEFRQQYSISRLFVMTVSYVQISVRTRAYFERRFKMV